MSELSRLRWHCRRGMKELDQLLERYVDRYYEGATAEHQAAFRALLDLQDPELYGFLLGRSTPENDSMKAIIDRVRGEPDT